MGLSCRKLSSLFTHCSFDNTKNEHDYYRGEDCIKNLCKDLKEHIAKIINCEKKKMIRLTKKENKSYLKQKICIYAKVLIYDNSTDNDNKKCH